MNPGNKPNSTQQKKLRQALHLALECAAFGQDKFDLDFGPRYLELSQAFLHFLLTPLGDRDDDFWEHIDRLIFSALREVYSQTRDVALILSEPLQKYESVRMRRDALDVAFGKCFETENSVYDDPLFIEYVQAVQTHIFDLSSLIAQHDKKEKGQRALLATLKKENRKKRVFGGLLFLAKILGPPLLGFAVYFATGWLGITDIVSSYIESGYYAKLTLGGAATLIVYYYLFVPFHRRSIPIFIALIWSSFSIDAEIGVASNSSSFLYKVFTAGGAANGWALWGGIVGVAIVLCYDFFWQKLHKDT